MNTADILVNAANDAYFALSSMDRAEAERILDAYVAAYDSAPEKAESDLFSGPMFSAYKAGVASEFSGVIQDAVKKAWIKSLTREQAITVATLLYLAPSGNAHFTICQGVDIGWFDIKTIKGLEMQGPDIG